MAPERDEFHLVEDDAPYRWRDVSARRFSETSSARWMFLARCRRPRGRHRRRHVTPSRRCPVRRHRRSWYRGRVSSRRDRNGRARKSVSDVGLYQRDDRCSNGGPIASPGQPSTIDRYGKSHAGDSEASTRQITLVRSRHGTRAGDAGLLASRLRIDVDNRPEGGDGRHGAEYPHGVRRQACAVHGGGRTLRRRSARDDPAVRRRTFRPRGGARLAHRFGREIYRPVRRTVVSSRPPRPAARKRRPMCRRRSCASGERAVVGCANG